MAEGEATATDDPETVIRQAEVEAAAGAGHKMIEVLREVALGGQNLCCPQSQWMVDKVQGMLGMLGCTCPMGVQ